MAQQWNTYILFDREMILTSYAYRELWPAGKNDLPPLILIFDDVIILTNFTKIFVKLHSFVNG